MYASMPKKRARHNFTRFCRCPRFTGPKSRHPQSPPSRPLKPPAKTTHWRELTHSTIVGALTFTLLARSCLPNICCTLRVEFVRFSPCCRNSPGFSRSRSLNFSYSLSLSLSAFLRLSLSLFTLLSLFEVTDAGPTSSQRSKKNRERKLYLKPTNYYTWNKI